MREFLPFLLFLLLIGAANALRWWMEKQKQEKEHAEQEGRKAERGPEAAAPRKRPVFYGRPADRKPTAAPRAEPPRPQPSVPPVTRPRPVQAIRPQPAERREPPAPRTAARPQAARRAAPGPARPSPARAELEKTPHDTRAVQKRRPSGLEPPKVSALRDQVLATSLAQQRLAAAAEPSRPGTTFFGNLLKGRNLAKAVALSEIFGPPKALRDL